MASSITISSLQHYAHCPRQWGLAAIENEWSDNFKTISGNIVHKKVDEPFSKEKRSKKVIVRSIPVYFEEFEIYGIVDCVEFWEDKTGPYIPQLNGNYHIKVIEYKNGKPTETGEGKRADCIQVAAQLLCINHMFNTEAEGFLFYDTIKRRVKVEKAEDFFVDVYKCLKDMRSFLSTKTIPDKRPKQNCNNCSFISICIPKTTLRNSQRERILKLWRKYSS